MDCPKCHGTNIIIQMVEQGSKTKKTGIGLGGHAHNAVRGGAAFLTLGMSNFFIKEAKGEEKTRAKVVKMAICQECGRSWKIR